VIGRGIHRQAWRAIDEADALVLVVDGAAGLAPLDAEVARNIRATGKPVILGRQQDRLAQARRRGRRLLRPGPGRAVRGVGGPRPRLRSPARARRSPCSASAPAPDAHGRGRRRSTATRRDADVDRRVRRRRRPRRGDDADDAPTPTTQGGDDAAAGRGRRTAGSPHRADADAGPVRIALLGKPNAGKSSLCNRLLGEERSLVHHQPGTTTDPVDSPLTFAGKRLHPGRHRRHPPQGAGRGGRREARGHDGARADRARRRRGAGDRRALGPSEQDARLPAPSRRPARR
jgi:hypothetical protein